MSKPSLRALRAFSLVNRCGTVAAAARALGVSPSAVSHLLRELELALGLTLFEGKGGAGGLTEAGSRLRDGIGNAFQSIDRAVENTLRRDGEVRASLLTSFATLWLVARLPLFQASHPRTRLLVSTDIRAVDLASEPFDCAVRWGRANWPALDATLLFHECPVIVANPRLGLRRDGLDDLPRLAAKTRPEDWPLLERAMGLKHVEPGLTFQTRAMTVQAAVAGLGAAVVDRHLISDLLAAGLLVEFEPETRIVREEGHFFVTTREALRDPHVRALRDWLLSQTGPARPQADSGFGSIAYGNVDAA